MRRLIATCTLACCLLGALATAMPAAVGVSTAHAQTQDGSGVEKLWEEFPLKNDRNRAENERPRRRAPTPRPRIAAGSRRPLAQ